LAGLILATIVLEVAHRRGHFALVLLTVVIGFGISLAAINVDGFITNQNVALAQAGNELDVNHLNTLSADAVPAMIRRYQDPALPQEIKDGLGAALACRQKLVENAEKRPWQAFNFSQARAARLLKTNSPGWYTYQPYQEEVNLWKIMVNGEEVYCEGFGVGMD